ncbi:MAG: hypothetical protein ACFFC7_14510 [Candidatus Hermodarchaeota archaeon]
MEGWSSQQITTISRGIAEFTARLSNQTVRQSPPQAADDDRR